MVDGSEKGEWAAASSSSIHVGELEPLLFKLIKAGWLQRRDTMPSCPVCAPRPLLPSYTRSTDERPLSGSAQPADPTENNCSMEIVSGMFSDQSDGTCG